MEEVEGRNNEDDARLIIEHEGSPIKLARKDGVYSVKRGREIVGAGKSVKSACLAAFRAIEGKDTNINPACLLLAAAVSVDSDWVEAATDALYGDEDDDEEEEEDGEEEEEDDEEDEMEQVD